MSIKNIVKCVLCDMDGVVRIGSSPIAGTKHIFSYLQELKMNPIIITNECRYTNEQIYKDLCDMNILEESNKIHNKIPIITSANVCKSWLEKYMYKNNLNYSTFNVCVIGEKGLKHNINSINSPYLQISNKYSSREFSKNILIVGSLFNYTINHKNILKEWLSKSDTMVIKTCDDLADPSGNCILPSYILNQFNKVADVNVGKPDKNYAIEIYKTLKQNNLSTISPNEILLIGDTMYTDIKMGNELGFKTMLVLTGNTKKSDIKTYNYRPSFIIPSIAEINKYYN